MIRSADGDLTQDDVIDLLSLYMTDIIDLIPLAVTVEQRAHLDGVITGMAISIAIAAGRPGPITGEELAKVGAELAEAVVARIMAEGKGPWKKPS